MNFNINKRYSLIIISSLIIIGITASIIFFNNKNNKTIEVEAIVKMIGENYIIVEDDNGEKYSLETNEEYSIGDRVDFLIKEINNKREELLDEFHKETGQKLLILDFDNFIKNDVIFKKKISDEVANEIYEIIRLRRG